MQLIPTLRWQKQLILQRGTTGFQSNKAPHLPVVDLSIFRAAFHAVARTVSADVIRSPRRNPEVECNFADALLQIREDRIVVLVNCFHPLIAFASETSVGTPHVFRDHIGLTDAFSAYPEFTVVSLVTLMKSPNSNVLSNLSPAEMEQFNYWKPPRIGDVIFNYWG